MSKPGCAPGTYVWRDQTFTGQDAVAEAAGVRPHVVSYHLNRHGNLNRLGVGKGSNWPKDGRGATRRPVSLFGREWASMSDFARHVGYSISAVKTWLDNDDTERLMAAMMAAEARRAT